jgi:hypothetical protein
MVFTRNPGGFYENYIVVKMHFNIAQAVRLSFKAGIIVAAVVRSI